MQKKVFPLITVLKKSTLAEIKESSGKPKSVVSLLHNAAGGITGAMSASELPRNRRQIYTLFSMYKQVSLLKRLGMPRHLSATSI